MKRYKEGTTRRDFITSLSMMLGGGVCTSCKNSPKSQDVPDNFPLAHISKLEKGLNFFSSLRVSLFVDHISNQISIRALRMVCTHQECAIRPPGIDPQMGLSRELIMTCPCHGAQFDYRGEVLRGPATKPLEWLKISASDEDMILLHPKEKVGYDWSLIVPEAS